jgi:hypothetical protein
MRYAKYGAMVLMLAFVTGITTPRAAAQEAFRGTFHLTAETYWGKTLLPPGPYTVTMSLDPAQRIRMVRLEGDGLRAFFLTGPPTLDRISHRSTLRLENINGVYVVRHLDAGMLGQSYVFPVSKNVRIKGERASAPSQVAVPISAGGSY